MTTVAAQTSKASTAPKSERKRIVLVVNDMGFGGAEVQVAELARRLVRRGHHVTLVTLVRFIDFEDDLRAHGVVTRALGMTYGRPTLRGVLKLARVIREARADVVHAHLLGATVMTRLASLLAPGTRVVCSGHSSLERSKLRYRLLGLTDPLGDVWTSVSTLGLETFVSNGAVPRKKAVHVPNGVDVTTHTPLSAENRRALRETLGMPNRFIWLAVGSFRSEEKDYDTLIEAVARLDHAGCDFEIWVAGTGTLLEAKRQRAVERGIGTRMRFLGLRKDVTNLMRAADAYVLSSSTEAFPIVLLEASASALPIVSTRVGDAPSIVIDGRTGAMVAPRDPAALADAMTRTMELAPGPREALGSAARHHVEQQFDMERIIDRWLAVYETGAARPTRDGRG